MCLRGGMGGLRDLAAWTEPDYPEEGNERASMTNEVVVRRTVTACLGVKEADAMCERITNGLIHQAATYLMLAELVLELDESLAWQIYEDHDGGQMFRDVWHCLEVKVLAPLSMSKPVVVAMRRAALAYIQVFRSLDVKEFQETYPNIPWDDRTDRPVLSMRAMLKLAQLNDEPELQARAFRQALQASGGKLTEKSISLQVSRLLPQFDDAEEELQDAKLRQWLGRILASFESSLRAMEEEAKMPKKIVSKTKNLIKVMTKLYERIKAV